MDAQQLGTTSFTGRATCPCESLRCAARSPRPTPAGPTPALTPARLRMGGAAAQLLLAVFHVFVSEYVLMLWSKVQDKDDKKQHKFVQARAASSRVIFRDR